MELPNRTSHGSSVLCDPNTSLLFSPANISEALKRLKRKATGPDRLKAQLLKCARLEIAEIVSTLFNQCLFNSFVPLQWKESNITPIPKDSTNYRPISINSDLCKTFDA